MDDLIDAGDFDKPVRVEIGARELDVYSTLQAAEMLMYDWPIGETGARMEARMTCMKVLGGSEPPETARKAFTKAAKEADILAC
ncbi:DUF982 domain-containing protein [Aquamicrobium sp. LC103]|uniref:DUF982 domain-containing protein n=1 Tax=Aquamicrobium sp. LC103 TaxID=1120658 RepID=UPI00063E9937|nr:DUF982 domain-containing protein [Aquamicrobium sp. LC103]TKT80005.1 DUF982 domain-containing protein [Aquamicrobium sp. LC103]